MADDVHWLKSQGGLAEKSFLFVVDSAMRDKLAYPTPSDYVVPLPMPLRNVFSVDLVDATIPRTEYSVERATNTLVIAVTQAFATIDAARAAGAAVSVSVPPGNYNVLQLIEVIDSAHEQALHHPVSRGESDGEIRAVGLHLAVSGD